jgi:tetratricopeptide (TPR) repeat protein
MIAVLMTGNDRDGMLSLNGIMSRCFAWACLTIAVCAGLSFGRGAADPKQVYDQATEALYNLDFTIAQQGYETLTREYPDNPDYWNALASAIWLKITYDQQKLNLESFSSRSTFGTAESKESLNPEDEKRLRDTIAVAIAKADALLKKNPNDARALYAKGTSSATLASFEGTVKRSYLSALSDAKTARSLHQQVLKLDPNFDDARLSVGAYDYVAGVVPWGVRVFFGLFGMGGAGKEVGIQELQTVAEKGKNNATDAKMILSVVYAREKRYDDALRVMSELHSKYPRNFLFELSIGSTYGKKKQWQDAVHTYEQILGKIQSRKDGYERLRVERIRFLLGTSHVELLQFDRAVDEFSSVASSNNSPPDERAKAYLWVGNIFDSKKDRTKALQQYEAVLNLNCNADLKADAQRYKRRPFGE